MPTVAIDTSDASAPELRGWGRYVRELAWALDRREAADGLTFKFLDGSRARGPELLWEQVTLPRVLRSSGADAVHAPNVFLPLRRPCPGVVTVHDLAFEEHPEDFSRRTGWKYRSVAPRAVRSAERVICVSDWTRGDLERRYGADPSKLRVVYSAPALPGGDEQPPAGPYVLAVGDLREKKNFARLAAAFRLLHAEGLPHRLLIAGADVGEGERITRAAAGAPVQLLGFVDDSRLDALMRGADLLVHPSLYEGFGLVLLEAMTRGCPVAAADATALPETCAGAALLFDPYDERAIAQAMRHALGDANLRRDLSERGKVRAAEFSWEQTAADTAAVYREVVS
jgi:glycosyltransferase involved in cell wall biosynthesis